MGVCEFELVRCATVCSSGEGGTWGVEQDQCARPLEYHLGVCHDGQV